MANKNRGLWQRLGSSKSGERAWGISLAKCSASNWWNGKCATKHTPWLRMRKSTATQVWLNLTNKRTHLCWAQSALGWLRWSQSKSVRCWTSSGTSGDGSFGCTLSRFLRCRCRSLCQTSTAADRQLSGRWSRRSSGSGCRTSSWLTKRLYRSPCCQLGGRTCWLLPTHRRKGNRRQSVTLRLFSSFSPSWQRKG